MKQTEVISYKYKSTQSEEREFKMRVKNMILQGLKKCSPNTKKNTEKERGDNTLFLSQNLNSE